MFFNDIACFHICPVSWESYPRSYSGLSPPKLKNMDILFNFLFHSITTCCIITLLFEIYRCVSRDVGYIFICYRVLSETFQ